MQEAGAPFPRGGRGRGERSRKAEHAALGISNRVPQEIKDLRAELADVEDEMRSIRHISELSPEDGKMFSRRFEELLTLKTEVEEKLSRMDIRRPIEKEDLKAFIERLGKIKSLSEDRQKELIQLCVKKVVCKADSFQTELCIPMVAGEEVVPDALLELAILFGKRINCE